MVKALRKRPRLDTLVNEKRRVTNVAGRMVYLALLVAFALTILNYLFGDFVFLRADGLVVRDHIEIASTYLARVEEVAVKEGQRVNKGEVLLRLQSADLLERLADLSARRAQLAAREVDFKTRAATVSQLLPLAKRRQVQANDTVDKFERLINSGLSTAANFTDVLRNSYDAQQDHVRLATQDRALRGELLTLERARGDADLALENLKVHYGDGVVLATVNGSVGATVPAVGSVYRPGDPILSIYSGEPYVLAYLPRRYLFPIRVGLKVTISDGKHQATGVVSEILPVTDALPKEFQNSFKPRDRNQLAKIRFKETPPFPLHDKVAIERSYAQDLHSLYRTAAAELAR